MTTFRFLLPLAGALPLALSVSAQDGLSSHSQEPHSQPQLAQSLSQAARIAIHTADDDATGGAYGIWAAGNGYKVSFHNGMTFVPMLGKSTPETVRLSWQTSSIRVGNHELLTGDPGTPHQASSHRYEYHHGTVIEAYDVRVEGLEQTFVVADRPSHYGDLVVTGTISGNVRVDDRAASHTEILFRDESNRSVISYGAATAIDAQGRHIAMTTAIVAGKVQLKLNAEAAASAAYPLVIDPILGNNLMLLATDITDVDVFRDDQETNSNVWVAYSHFASATDADLVIRRYPDGLQAIGTTVYTDVTTGWSSVETQLAGTGGSGIGKVIGAFTREFTGGTRRVRWHLHNKNDLSLLTSHGSAPWTSGTCQTRPDVGGSASFGVGNTAMIVFQQDTGTTYNNGSDSKVMGTRVDVTAGSSGTASPLVELGNSAGDEERPAINELAEGGAEYSWLVAWQHHNNGQSAHWNVQAQRVHATFGFLGTTRFVGQSADDEMQPKVAGANGRYLVAFAEKPWGGFKPSQASGRRVAARRIRWQHADANGFFAHVEQVLLSSSSQVFEMGDCAFDTNSESHWIVTATDITPNGEQLIGTKVGFDGGTVEQVLAHDIGGFKARHGGVSFDDDNEEFVLAFGVDNNTSSNTLWTTRITYESVPAPQVYGGNCSGATTSFQGSQHVGGEFETFRLNSTFPNGVVLFSASLGMVSAPLDAFGMTGCNLAINPLSGQLLGNVAFVTDAAGNANYVLPIPSTIPPVEVFTQWAVLDPAANPAGVTTTSGLSVRFGR